jgi:hypothetical protein
MDQSIYWKNAMKSFVDAKMSKTILLVKAGFIGLRTSEQLNHGAKGSKLALG